MKVECSGADCVEIVPIGADWFRIHSTINSHVNVALTGNELRAFFAAVKAGQFDELVGVDPLRAVPVSEILAAARTRSA